ncbi:hypothetical protein [Emcibacter sp. SYSU 3D8]|uniref:hypothetical protein n=1 Tax=Emcibacter sp. SYSU 3D8 TaxID=3133969 RepID=UPI0031FE9550
MAGRMPGADHGTLLTQMRRAEAVGARVLLVEDGKVVADVDPALSGSQLAILLARGAIGRQHFDAGERYQQLAWAAYGRPFARAVDIARPRGDMPAGEGVVASDSDDRRRSGARKALARVDSQLAALGAGRLQAVKQTCQFDMPPPAAAVPLLAAGLDALAALWGMGGPRRRTGA